MNQLLKTKIKIVGTLGPNSADQKMIEKMLIEGLTVARVNMSHGDFDVHANTIKNARAAAKKTKRPLALLQDLSGPKIRIGDFDTEDVTLVNGNKLVLTTEKCVGTVERVSVNYEKLPKEVEVGMHIYLNDGKQKLLVEKIADTDIHTKIISGGTIKGRRGVNVPDADLSISSLTPKDKKDLKWGLDQKFDFVTLSFVRNAKDINDLRKLIPKERKIAIVAKIETKFAIENLEEIVEAADVIMVARGDLAIEMPLEKVPLLQKRIIKTANRLGKPVITATQMLDSMRIATVPTRAEVADIANAILDGTDAIMLSDETTIGNHPDLAISVMSRIAHEIENDPLFIEHQADWNFSASNVYDGVSRSIARNVVAAKAKAIVALSESGHTGRVVARYRPQVPIIVLTPSQETFNKMLVVYGCEPVLIKSVKSLQEAQKMARKMVIDYGIAKTGEAYILTAGIPFGSAGATNMMIVEKV
ncbi:MAG: pyruvate kinase [Candidatus Pacebacteria bacterium]|nr:pyruvate kinase [Candidatus Paceibacterota bacterium]MBP9843036.1 pyruvate kinase [Candidatus Paceibacterota bacterium]